VGHIAEPTIGEIITVAQEICADAPVLVNATFRDLVEFIL